MKKTVLGLGFIALAILILVKDQLGLGNIPIWTILWALLFAGLSLHQLLEKNWIEALFMGSLVFIILNASVYVWVNMSSWILVVASALFCIGLKMIFSPKKSWVRLTYHQNEKDGSGESRAFSNTTRYINAKDYVTDSINIIFGSNTVYFDNTDMLGDVANFDIDAVFGKITLYIPKDWRISVEISDQVFSHVTTPNVNTEAEKVLRLTGDLVFSNVDVKYI